MSIINTSTELFTDSDNSSDENFESASSLSSISTASSFSSISSISSISNTSSISQRSSPSFSEPSLSDQSFENMPVRTRRSRMMMDSESQSSGSSAESEDINERSTFSQISDNDHEMSSTGNSSVRTENNTNNSSESSDTEAYDVDAEMMRVNDSEAVIEINDSQIPDDNNDDDVILIPQNIETIDLCTQAAPVPIRLQNQIIDITDSPANENSRFGPIRRMNRRRISQVEIVDNTQNALQSPKPSTSIPSAQQQLNLDDSFNETQPKFALSCPICMESMVSREPISTICGHLFCKCCITLALQNAKKCPMCKKTLSGKKPFFNIFLPC